MDRLGHLVRAVDTEDGEVVLGIVEAEGVAPLRNVEAISELLQLELAKIESEMSETGPPRAEATSRGLALDTARERVRRAEIGLSILRRYMPEAKVSPKKGNS